MIDQATFEVMPGLPGYGPAAESFTATGKGAHREGYVVRITPTVGSPWVGNFQPGLTNFSGVFRQPDGQALVIVSRGQGYLVDSLDPHSRGFLSADISAVYPLPERSGLIINRGTCLVAIDGSGELWRTPRFSWDGIYDVEVQYPELRGLSWSPLTDTDVPFTVNLSNGDVVGGSYNHKVAGRSTD